MTFTKKWARLSLLNFVVLASVGVLLRYKILFSLPGIDYKNLLHAHSHFAFAGWVSTALYVAIIHILQPQQKQLIKYNLLMWVQQLSSYGMLFTFPFMGYALPSIAFSTLSIFVSFWFAYLVSKQLAVSTLSFQKKWLYAALGCNIVSSIGTFTLAWLMANRIAHQDLYFGSVYFYLHFQYNGWFLFTIFGLLFTYAAQWMNALQIRYSNYFFYLLLAAVLPAWFLSMLWMRVPAWIHIGGIIAAVLQLLSLVYFFRLFLQLKKFVKQSTKKMVEWLWSFSMMAFMLKLVLQAFSAIPQLNKYAFGIRPIVIGFLHLVLLGFVSLFIVGFLIQQQLIKAESKSAHIILWVLAGSIFANELILMIQGVTAISNSDLPNAPHFLLCAALGIFTSLLLLLIHQFRKQDQQVVQ